MKRVLSITASALCAALAIPQPAAAQDNPAARAAREWRQAREPQLLAEYFEFLKIPNVSRDTVNVRHNAEHLLRMMEKRGLKPRLLEVPGASPAVYGEILAPGAAHTYVFYAHYDGQPVNPKDWATPPFEPALRTARLDKGGRVVPLPAPGQRMDPKPRANVKFIFEGEEEIDSPHLDKILAANKELLKADLWLICDGPEHSSGRQTVTFGARGIQKLEITVYGPNRELHSGHYGNWAPNPAMMLAQLLASMKDADGRVLVEHFYDGVVPLGELEKKAIAEAPDNDSNLMREFGLARVDAGGRKLAEMINQPSLNVRGMASAQIGAQAANAIPSTATAAIDLRLVRGVTKEGQVARVTEHIRKQGYYLVNVDPDEKTRLAYPRIAKVAVDAGGYNAVRTKMDLPAAEKLVATARSVRSPVVLQPTSGGSVPLDMIIDILGTNTIQVPAVNYDNNQHSANENVRLQNLWNAIELQAALLMME